MRALLARIARALRPPAWSPNRDPLGPAGELAAERHLRSKGFSIIARNARVPMGEADLVCRAPDGTIVIVEVKSRRVVEDAASPPAELNVTARKRRKLRAIMRHLTRANRWHRTPRRIDIIAVDFANDEPVELRHHPGAVSI